MEPLGAISTWAGLDELRPLLQDYLRRRCRDENEADDVIQETLLRASRYRGSLEDPGRLRPWVLRIALNVLRDQIRRERRLPKLHSERDLFELIEGREGIPGDAQEDLRLTVEGQDVGKRQALRELGRAKLRMLTPDQEVLDSYYQGAGSCRETALECEIPPDLVKIRLFRARGRLRGALKRGLRFTRDPWDGLGDSVGPEAEPDARGDRAYPGTRREGASCAFRVQTLESGAPSAAEGRR